MDDLKAIITLVTNSSVTIVIISYFIFRDYKFMMTLQNTLTTLVNTVDVLKDILGGTRANDSR